MAHVQVKGRFLTGCMHLSLGLALVQAKLDVTKNAMSGSDHKKKLFLLKAAATFIL